MEQSDEDLLTVKEVGKILNVSVRTVWRLVEEKKLYPPRRPTAHCPRWVRRDVMIFKSRVARGEFDEKEPEKPPKRGTREVDN